MPTQQKQMDSRLSEIEWLRLDILQIANYQRAISKDKVKIIEKNFDIDKVGCLAVNLRENGEYYLVDGQHRHMAALNKGITTLPCLVYIGLSEAEESALRIAFNARRPDSALDIFRLRLSANDPLARRIKYTVEQCGLNLSLTATKGGNNLSCVSMIEKIVTRYAGGFSLLERVLRLNVTIWYVILDKQSLARSAVVIGGMALFLNKYPEVKDAELITKLQQWPPAMLVASARESLKARLNVGGIETHFARALLHRYNFKRRSGKLPDRFIA